MQFKTNENLNSNKIPLDKYYTSSELAKELIKKTYDIIGTDNIGRVIEPSAGGGAFSSQIPNCIAYDIKPAAKGIIKANYLDIDIEYKENTLIIGNPPFGRSLSLANKFMKKHYKEADYIAFILPISQYRNNYFFYEFNLIYSENLGVLKYSDREVHCCFNIYKRPSGNKLNKRKDMYKLPEWLRMEEKKTIKKSPHLNKDYSGIPDIAICAWGSAGKVVKEGKTYAKELGFYIDKKEYKDLFIKFIEDFEYSDFYWADSGTIAPCITRWRMREHIIDNFLKPNKLI